jgi:hypothetical protein
MKYISHSPFSILFAALIWCLPVWVPALTHSALVIFHPLWKAAVVVQKHQQRKRKREEKKRKNAPDSI